MFIDTQAPLSNTSAPYLSFIENSPDENPPKILKLATKKQDEEEPKKSLWQNVFYGLAVGALSMLMKFLPEKIGEFFSKIIPPLFKTDNPFDPEA